jgi:hypothetical protein
LSVFSRKITFFGECRSEAVWKIRSDSVWGNSAEKLFGKIIHYFHSYSKYQNPAYTITLTALKFGLALNIVLVFLNNSSSNGN